MINKLSMLTAPLILSMMCGCATQRVIASSECPQPAPLTAELKVPAPDPLLFQKCLQELLAQTSDQGLTSSCKQLSDWTSSTLIGSNGNETVVPTQTKAP